MTQTTAMTSSPLGAFPTSIDLDFLKLEWSVGASGIEFSARIGMGPLSWSKTFDLTYAHPSVTLSTPSVAHYAGSVSVSFDDATGQLHVEAKVTWWALGDHDKKVSHDLEILPPFILGLVAQGCRFPAVLEEAAAIADAALDYNKLGAIEGALRRAAGSVQMSMAQANDFIKGQGQLMNAMLHAAPSAALCAQIGHIPTKALIDGLHAVVNDPRIQARYPGIQNRLRFPDAQLAPKTVAVPRATADNASASDVIVTILETVAELAGIAAAVIGAIAVFIGAILAILLLPVEATGLAVAAAIFALVAAVVILTITLIGAAAAVIALIIKGIVCLTD